MLQLVRNPPFRADHVGSFLRPEALLRARAQSAQGQLSGAALREIEDAAIIELVRWQESLGLKVVTDGEYRRRHFHTDFLVQLQGVQERGGLPTRFHRSTGEVDFSPPVMVVTGPVRHRAPIELENYRFLASSARALPKITIPSPTMLHFRGGRREIDHASYPDLDAFFADVATAYRQEISALAHAGLRYLQLDDTNLAYLCDPLQRERARARREDPDKLPQRYASLINDALEGAPDDMIIGLHLCRGNYRSAWAADGGYEAVAEVLFNAIDVDAYFLEYDDARSGDFSPLRHVPKGKTVVLGLVTTKLGELESADSVYRRIEEAARFCPIEQLALSPQCGFSSTEHGNDISMAQQAAKLRLVIEVADKVWGEA